MTEPTQLHALADGELDPREAHALREALKADPRAAAEVDAVLNLKEFLRDNAPRHTDEEVWHGCVRRLDEIDRSRRAEGFVSRYAWALCGVLFLFIVSGRFAMRNVQGDSASTADLAGVFHSSAPVTDSARMKSRLYEAILGQAGKGLDPNEIEILLPTQGFVQGRPAMRIPMRDGEGDLVLLRIRDYLNIENTAPLDSNPNLYFGVVDEENGLVWHPGNETWVLSGARSVDALHQVASRLFGAQ